MLQSPIHRMILLLLCSTAFILFANSIKAQPSSAPLPVYFQTVTNYSAGYEPASLIKGDFNGDGKLDLAVSNWIGYTISVLLGNGTGSFPAHTPYAAQSGPFQIATGDFNNDGKIDLITANGPGNSVSVFLGNGNGTFQPEIRTPAGSTPYGIAVGDFNRDKELDIAVANRSGNTVSVLLGLGNATFQPPVEYATGQGGFRVIAQDLNKDGKLDLAVTSFDSNTVSILLGTGKGTFSPATNYPVGASPRGVAAGDLNGDGNLDLVVGNNGSDDVSVLLGTGEGVFALGVNIPAGVGPNALVLADLNGDKNLDIVVSSHVNYVSVLLGNGDATFGQRTSYSSDNNSSDVVVDDFNNDGSLDIATSNFYSFTVSILLQSHTPPATPTATATLTPTSTPSPTITPTPGDTTPPLAQNLTVNSGAISTTSTNVALSVLASDLHDNQSSLLMSFSNDGVTWNSWRPYAATTSWQLSQGDGTKSVYGRFADRAGNISNVVSDTIELDTHAQTEYGVTINQGALFTNQVTVTLTISARPKTTEMQISNDGGFYGVAWEPYSATKTWQITQYSNVVIPRVVYVRYRDSNGVVSAIYQDDIILDMHAPQGDVQVSQDDQDTATGSVMLKLNATDDASGVGSMRLSARADFADAQWEPYVTSRVWKNTNSGTIYIQFRDNTGNISSTSVALLGSKHVVLLPVVIRSR